jgi:hypothetical protein
MYATDILIAGCGWVELVAQVRRRRMDDSMTRLLDGAGLEAVTKGLPEVEVWSPEGKVVSSRTCIEAWALGKRVRRN